MNISMTIAFEYVCANADWYFQHFNTLTLWRTFADLD